ncbi:MAG: TolC family protein [Planctomycetia bacterium]|nr:TolC family protein [Planctomycetia bacterium]
MGSLDFHRSFGVRALGTGLVLSLALATSGLEGAPPQSILRRRAAVAQSPLKSPMLSQASTSNAPPAIQSEQKSRIRQASAVATDEPTGVKERSQSATAPDAVDDSLPDERSLPIDLGSALRLAGVENLELIEARQRVEWAVAQQQFTAAQILPNINLGTNYDAHTGNLQQASGNILKVQRSALYVGAGANAVAAGTVPIPGVQWNLNVSESIYNYFAARKRSEQSQLASFAVENDVLLKVAVAYTELLQSRGRLSLAIITRNDAREVARLTANYAKTGDGRQSDADRAATELRRREEDLVAARAEVGQTSRRLAELLNLNVTTPLRPVESQVVPQAIVPNRIPLAELIAVAMLDRPELKARQAAIQAALLELDSAKMLPFSPQLMLGFSGGLFGGGSNLVASSTPPAIGLPPNQPRFGDFKGRTDIDAILFWSVRNLGLGNKALIDAARARACSADFEQQATLDQVRREVADAFVRTHIQFAQIEVRARGVRSGADALSQDFTRVQGREGKPIELLDSLRQLATERRDYLDAIADYNKAQFELYVALGRPPADLLARPVPQDLSTPPE